MQGQPPGRRGWAGLPRITCPGTAGQRARARGRSSPRRPPRAGGWGRGQVSCQEPTSPLAWRRLGTLGGPRDVGGPDAGTDRVPPGVGEADPGDELVAWTHGVLDEAGIDVDKPELGAAEQPERAIARDLTPGQAEVAVAAIAGHEGPPEVDAVVAAADLDLDLPPGRMGVAGHPLAPLPPAVPDGKTAPGRTVLRPSPVGPRVTTAL